MEKIKKENINPPINTNIKLIYTKLFLAVIGFALLFVCGAKSVEAATLYISPASGSYTVGGVFSVNIFVSSTDHAMNAASGIISFPQEKLEVVSLSKSGSIVSLWVLEPTFSNGAGTINFEGIVLNPGFTGSAGKIVIVNFKTKAAGSASLTFSSGSILANDGQGTNILTGMGSGSYKISSEVITPKEKEKPVTPKPKPAPAPDTKEKKLPEDIEISKPEIFSPAHSDQAVWHNSNDVEFKWELPYGVTEVSILLDDKPDSNPGPISDGLFSTKSYPDLEDGVWYLHLKLKDEYGWSEIEHFKIQIDTTPPQPFQIEIEQKEIYTWPVLNFKTTDETSGIDRYEVEIDSPSSIFKIVKPEDAFLKAPVLPPGQHTAIVKAIDKAGNETIAVADFTIEPIEAPVIKSYPRELKSTDTLFISGIALPDVAINVFIQSEKTEKIIKRTSLSNQDGKWCLTYQDELINGQYFIWAQAINSQGMKSEISNKISFLVTSPIFVKFGSWVINYFTVFIALLLFTILVIAFLAFWAGLMRNKLKKETDEAQTALHKNLKDLKKLMAKEINRLDKLEGKDGHSRERAKIRKTIQSRINFIEKKILGEIKDIEDLLK